MFGKFSFKKKGTEKRRSDPSGLPVKIPAHIAIIMDGNGRWAKKRGMPRIAGHREAMKTVRQVTRAASDLGVKVLTLYAFSTENWRRPKKEVEFLMRLPEQFLNSYLVELIENNVQVRVMGDLSRLPSYTQKAVSEAMVRTQKNDGMILNFALNYGSHAEIAEAVQAIVRDVRNGAVDPKSVNEQLISKYLMSRELPDPDLLIRTGGEVRLSNFMLWQAAYAELWFTDVFWPDFSEKDLQRAIIEFGKRQRRYGGLKENGSGNE